MIVRRPRSPLFPYTTLFRSRRVPLVEHEVDDAQHGAQPLLQLRLRRHHGGNAKAELQERSEEHTSELQSRLHLVCRLLLEKKKVSERVRQTPRLSAGGDLSS